MKTFIAAVIVFALLSGGAALKCYQCKLKDSDANCNSRGPTQCDNDDADTCKTLSAKTGNVKTITKMCSLKANCQRARTTAAATTCKAGLESVSGCIRCCQGDACNTMTSFRSDATITTVNSMAVIAMATVVSMFFMV